MSPNKKSDQFQPNRRDVLGAALVGAAAVALPPLPVAAATLPPANFLAASSRLCGITLDSSYLQLGNQVWLSVTGKGDPDYARICDIVMNSSDDNSMKAALALAGLLPKAQTLATVWYTGMNGSDVITYDNALVWRACEDFTKPPANCGGPFGYWHDKAEG